MTEQQHIARGKNIMLSLLEKRLSVPRIYLDVQWEGERVDMLAIDRDGSGDVHVVLTYLRPTIEGDLPETRADHAALQNTIDRLGLIRAQYKYVLGVATTPRWRVFGEAPSSEFSESTFSPDGLGRVGIAFAGPDDAGVMKANLVIFPERFRAFVGTSADEFIRRNPADWEVRA